MPTYLVCSNPVHGHVTPMLAAAAHLVERGNRVIVLTGSRFAEQVVATGAEFRALRGLADYDDRDPSSALPERDRHRGIARAQYDIQTLFVRPIPDQYQAVREVLDEETLDAVLVDHAFGGVVPLLFGPGSRPPILALGVSPLTQSSRDTAPPGTALPPSSSPIGRMRNRLLRFIAERVLFRPTQKRADRIFADLGVRPDRFVMDMSSAFDRFLQLSAAEFEYPRSDLAVNTEFIGPIPSHPASATDLPTWWADLDGGRPIVHVTQGTADNQDLDRLVRPTLRALEGHDVLVVVTLGGRRVDVLPDVPANARVASYVPYDAILPRASVLVTNGGYGGVQQALRAGVPLVVAGDSEEKPEVAARVAWSGAGIDVRTGAPTDGALRTAIERVLSEPDYRRNAQRIAEAIARLDTIGLLEEALANTRSRPRGTR